VEVRGFELRTPYMPSTLFQYQFADTRS
jgi:hypothetical protein